MAELFAGTGFTCVNVLEGGRPVMYVEHASDGTWQFICDGDEHDDHEQIRIIHGAHLADRDPSLLELRDLERDHLAERESPSHPWHRERCDPYDDDEDEEYGEAAAAREHVHERDRPRDANGLTAADRKCIADVEQYGLHIVQIPPDDEDDGFSFSVGLFATYAHPEIVVFGQKTKWQGDMLNYFASQVKAGSVYREGVDYTDILDGFACRFRSIREEQTYREYLGWNVWYYLRYKNSASLPPALQFVWPDRNGRFPDTPGYHSYSQPLLD